MNSVSTVSSTLKENRPSADTYKEGKLREACAGFEALMLKQLLTSARESIPKSGLLDGGYGEEIFQSLHDEQLAGHMAASGGTGFGELLYRQLSPSANLHNNR